MSKTTKVQSAPAKAVDYLARIKGDANDFLSFSGDNDDNGLSMTQHRYYRWGDNCVVAIGEMNHRNQWNDEAFDAKCLTLEAALGASKADQADKLRAALNAIADLGSCASGKEPSHKLLQKAIDLATGAL
jgi:hypothetical protein